MKIDKSVLLITAVLWPIVVESFYLWIANSPGFFMPGSHHLALVVGLGIGAVSLFLSIKGSTARLVAAIVYIPAAYFILVIYALAFVCLVFGNCL